MSRRMFNTLLAALIVLALAFPAVAKPVKANILLTEPTKLAGKQLAAGEYQLVAEDTKVTLSQNGKVVAEATSQWVNSNRKEPYHRIGTTGGEIREIRLRGLDRYLEIR